MKIIEDVTDKVTFDNNDSECLPLTMCVCGKEWESWNFVLGADKDRPTECSVCKRQLFFGITIKVYEVREK